MTLQPLLYYSPHSLQNSSQTHLPFPVTGKTDVSAAAALHQTSFRFVNLINQQCQLEKTIVWRLIDLAANWSQLWKCTLSSALLWFASYRCLKPNLLPVLCYTWILHPLNPNKDGDLHGTWLHKVTETQATWCWVLLKFQKYRFSFATKFEWKGNSWQLPMHE